MKSAVHFGAGNIGRGFIGSLLHDAGYHVTFVDVNTATVDALNQHGRYSVQLAAENTAPVVVDEISAVNGAGLVARHRFDPHGHAKYIDKVLNRFANPMLPDEVVRVGRSPLRKLGKDERLVAPARNALAAGTSPDNLARAITAALFFDFAGDPEAAQLQAELQSETVSVVLSRHTDLAVDDMLHRLVFAHYKSN